ncbi:anti-sigma factor family protein [Cohnella soli]|uniref:Anti-sigma-W factor RsiW n=1 Tax=Cohnella soli TaxID=425005 RepID=A0ABW0HXY9_9BACL
MNCEEVMELMQRDMDGDLNEQEKSLMKDHASRCPDCAAMLSRLQKLSNELEQLPRVVPRFSLVDAILPELERLQAEGATDGNKSAETSPKVVSRSERPARKVFGRVAGVVAAGVVVGFLLFGNPSGFLKPGGSSNNEAAAPSPQAAANMDQFGFATQQESLSGEAGSEMRISGGSAETKNDVTGQEVASPSSAPAAPADGDGKADTFAKATKSQDKESISANELNKSVAPSALDAPSSNENSLKFSVPADRAESPDGKWKAVAVAGEGTFKVYATSDDVNPNYVSATRDGEIGALSWNAEGTVLYFTYTAKDGTAEQWQFDVASATESKR